MEKKSASPCECQNIIGNAYKAASSLTGAGEKAIGNALLLHSCCGPCSSSVIERLIPDYDITVFFYNPCITDQEEYEKRKSNQIRFINEFNLNLPEKHRVQFIEGGYEPEEYYRLVSGYSNEPEGGARCEICFRQRLMETAKTAARTGFGLFTTTLTVSPHKNYELISAIGKEAGEKFGIEFLDIDFKKKAGFQRSIQLSREYSLYRQDYCGCEYSKRQDK